MPLTSKELLEESRRRRTYRSFLEEPVDLEVIKDCILTAGTAPSGAEFYRTLPDGTQDKNYYVPESAGISIGFLINAIRNAGYASLTYTPAPPAFLRTLLGRPEGETPVMVLCVGKPDPNYELPNLRKKTLEEIATFI